MRNKASQTESFADKQIRLLFSHTPEKYSADYRALWRSFDVCITSSEQISMHLYAMHRIVDAFLFDVKTDKATIILPNRPLRFVILWIKKERKRRKKKRTIKLSENTLRTWVDSEKVRVFVRIEGGFVAKTENASFQWTPALRRIKVTDVLQLMACRKDRSYCTWHVSLWIDRSTLLSP